MLTALNGQSNLVGIRHGSAGHLLTAFVLSDGKTRVLTSDISLENVCTSSNHLLTLHSGL